MQMVLPWKWSTVISVVHCVTISLFFAGGQFKRCRSLHVCLPLPSSPLPANCCGIQLLFVLHCALGTCCVLTQAIKVTNLGGLDTEQTSIDGNRARHDLTSWLIALLIALLIDCFLECGMHDVTFISPHSEDIKRKLLKLLHNYINEVQI